MRPITEIGGFNETLPVLGDWDFYLRFLSRFNIAILPKHLANYHQRPFSDGIYSNTVVAQKPIHLLYDNFLRNQYARNPQVIGLVPSLLASLAVGNDQKSDKKRKDLDRLTKSCLSLMNDRPDRVYIFGASEYGLFCKDLLADYVKVEGFIDNFHHGLSRIDGYPVFELDGLSGLTGAAVLVSSVGNREVIVDQLRQSPNGAALRIY